MLVRNNKNMTIRLEKENNSYSVESPCVIVSVP